MNNFKKVQNIRKKIFLNTKYSKFQQLLNQMMIPEIFDYNDCIPMVFSDPNYNKINKFKIGEYRILYEAVKQDVVNKQINNKAIIVVHPFYPILRHANFLVMNDDYLNKYIKYEKRMIKLLKFSNRDIILFESPDSFARYTYSFLKYGKIKKVIFTEHSYGKVLNKQELSKLVLEYGTPIVGCYGNNCLKEVEQQFNNTKLVRKNKLILERYSGDNKGN